MRVPNSTPIVCGQSAMTKSRKAEYSVCQINQPRTFQLVLPFNGTKIFINGKMSCGLGVQTCDSIKQLSSCVALRQYQARAKAIPVAPD